MRTSINSFKVLVPLESLVERLICAFCGNPDCKVIGKVEKNLSIQLVECRGCALVSTDHFPTNDFLEKYYTEKFPEFVGKYNQKVSTSVTFSNPRRFASRLAKLLSVDVFQSPSIKILDFGGGDGSLALAFSKYLSKTTSVEITVVDFGPSVVKSELPNISIRKLRRIPSSEKFDLIIASAVLEMLPDFGLTLKLLLNTLKDEESNLYIRTNYIQPLRRLFPFFDFSFPAHLHDIGSDFWSHFASLEESKYVVKKSETPISELNFKSFPIRYLIVTVLKLPSRIESRFFPHKLKRYWRFVGSWEVVVGQRS